MRETECPLEQCKKIRVAFEYYEHMTHWQVSCKGCADNLDKSYEAYCSEENERLRAEVEKLKAIINGPAWPDFTLELK